MGTPALFGEGAEHYDGMCYKIIQEKSLTWEEAQESCRKYSYHGRLAEPRTPESIDFLRSMTILAGNLPAVWLGARYSDENDKFVCVTSDVPVPLDDDTWQQSSHLHESGDYCLQILTHEIIDKECTDKAYFVCERNAQVQPCSVWEGSSYHGEYCYKAFDGPLSWSDAKEKCKAETPLGQLAEPHTETQMKYVRDMVMFDDNSFWLGGQKINPRNSPTWISGDIVQTNQWATDEPEDEAGCVSIMGEGWRQLKIETCKIFMGYVCQLYVGDVCQNSLPGGEFFAGKCYNFHNKSAVWSQANATCAASNSKLAEPYTEDIFGYIKKYARREGGINLRLPDHSPFVTLESYGLTFEGVHHLTFELKACQDAHVFFWKREHEKAIPTGNLLSDFVSEYYEVVLAKTDNNMMSEVKYWKRNYIFVTQKSALTLECNKTHRIELSWANEKELSYSISGTTHVFSHDSLKMKDIDRVGVAMGNSYGEWLINPSHVLLGATYHHSEDNFLWPTSSETVLQSFWLPGEPNNYDGGGENHTALWGFYENLNDFDAVHIPTKFIRQTDALIFNYMVVLPESGASYSKHSQIHVSTGHDASVYVDITYRVESLVFYDNKWLRRKESIELQLDVSRFELKGTGHHKKSVELQSTHEVTVVLFLMAKDHMGSTLVLPVNEISTQYFVLSYSEPSVDNQMTITATMDDTYVTIKFPCDDSINKDNSTETFLISSSSDGNIKHTTLDRGESVTVQRSADLSGIIISATHPVAVYVGNRKLETSSPGGTDNTLDAVLPINTLSTHYITFPSVPVGDDYDGSLPGGEAENLYKFMALYDNTSITIHTTPTLEFIKLEKSGDTNTTSLPDSFMLLESDRPFQVIKIANTSQGVCVTSLIPTTLWRMEYDFTVVNKETISLVVPTESLPVKVTVNDASTTLDCTMVKGIQAYYGCSLSLTNGTYHMRMSDVSTKFAAYTSSGVTDPFSSCHSLGVSMDMPDTLQTFPTDSYVYSQCGTVSPSVTCTPGGANEVECLPVTTTPATTEATTESTTPKTTSDSVTTLNMVSTPDVIHEVDMQESTQDPSSLQNTGSTFDVETPSMTMEAASQDSKSESDTERNTASSHNTHSPAMSTDTATEKTSPDLGMSQSTKPTLDTETASQDFKSESDTTQNTASSNIKQSLAISTEETSPDLGMSQSTTEQTNDEVTSPVTLEAESQQTTSDTAPLNSQTTQVSQTTTANSEAGTEGTTMTITTDIISLIETASTISSGNLSSLLEQCLSLITLLNTFENLTEHEISKLTVDIEEDLKIDVKNTSAHKRRITSAHDFRVSTTVMGVGSLAIVVSWILLFLLSDIATLVRYIFSWSDNAKTNDA